MSDKIEDLKEPALIIQEIAQRMDRTLVDKREEIDRVLTERINQEKEEARKRVEELEKQFALDKSLLAKHRADFEELREEREGLRTRLDEHIKQSQRYQGLIKNMASIAMEELNQITELMQKLESLRQKTSETAGVLQKDIRDRFGLLTQVDLQVETEESGLDPEQERFRLKRIVDLLKSGNEEGIPDGDPEKEAVAPGEESAAGPETIPAPPEEEMMMTALAKYRRASPTNTSSDIIYFEKNKKRVIDGESLVSPMAKVLDEAKALHALLAQKESPKDQFFVKHEIISQQEVLRKIFLKAVKACEKEEYSLPAYTSEIMSVASVKEILEKLSRGNWSHPYDFDSFCHHVTPLIQMISAKITSRPAYLESILRQLDEA